MAGAAEDGARFYALDLSGSSTPDMTVRPCRAGATADGERLLRHGCAARTMRP